MCCDYELKSYDILKERVLVLEKALNLLSSSDVNAISIDEYEEIEGLRSELMGTLEALSHARNALHKCQQFSTEQQNAEPALQARERHRRQMKPNPTYSE